MNIPMHCCVDGTNITNDIAILRQGVQIVVGTPGRVNDMIERGYALLPSR